MAKDAASAALLKPVAKSDNRNVFPLDNRQIYTMKAGQITPVKVQHFIPGDHFEIKPRDFTITFPMNTAAFMRGRKEFSFYSVYYSAVWSLYNQYMATREDPKTSAFIKNNFQVEPRVKLGYLYMECLLQWWFYMIWKYKYEWLLNNSANLYPNAAYLLKQFKATTFNSVYGQPLQFSMTYQASDLTSVTDTWNTWNIQSGWDLLVDPSYLISTEDLSIQGKNTIGDIAFDMTGHFRAYSHLRKLDMLGYGNLYPLFQREEQRIAQWCSTNGELLESRLLQSCDELISSIIKISATYSGTISSPTDIVYKMVNLYPICAYNLVFYHFFRNSYYDLNYYSHDYNLDFFYTNQIVVSDISLNQFSYRFLDIEYHQWKKDLFTSVLPDTQFGAVASVDITGVSNIDNKWINLQNGQPSGSVAASLFGIDSGRTVKIGSNTLGHTHDFVSAVDVIAVKRAEMLQQYRQTLMRAGNRTSDIFKALYGGAPSSEHEDDVIPRFLSTFGEDISVDPVIATATTGQSVNGQLGDLSARGRFRGEGHEFKLNVGKNFGCIIALAYVVPTSEYNSYILDKHVLELTPEQHFLPAYENFGLEAVYSDEINMLIPANQVKALGFASRYYHKKTALDLVHGAFCAVPASIMDHLHGASNALDPALTITDFVGDFNHWVSPRTDMQSLEFTRLSDFYINPSVLDNVFVRAAGSNQADDQFICVTYFQIKSTRALSKVGLINFV